MYIISYWAIVNVPGLQGGNVTMCTAISHLGVLHCHANLSPYSTMLLLTFLNSLLVNSLIVNSQDHVY